MRRRVFVVAGEYSANPRFLATERRQPGVLGEPHGELAREQVSNLFFRFPNRSDDGRTRPEDWERAFGRSDAVGLTDLFASAGHRALTTLHGLRGGDYRSARDCVTELYVTSMPGLSPGERMNIGLVPQELRAQLRLSPRMRAQFVVGTSDSGAWAFAQAVRAARQAERPATILVLAGQIIPSGYASQYQIRTVLGDDDQAHGLDMLAVGDLMMDVFRRNLGLKRDELEEFLARLAQRKLQTGARYPAGIQSGKPYKRNARRTPYFDAGDIAVPCCGAAATIITSDEALVEQIAASASKRFRAPPVTEVLGVGEGSSNANLLHRKSPLLFATAAREALADTADDARLPLSAFHSCAFGVAHDAFPSIELAFLLGLGFSWERSAERMAEGWSNPFGGLLSFGHAVGASGLVQVNKAHHLFCGDERYIADDQGPRRQGFRGDGALAFTTSVGGPLSHIVGGLFRGGFQDVPPREQAPARLLPQEPAPLSVAWRERRYQLRLAMPSYLRGVPGASLVEGATYVSIRSCLRALTPADVARLTFDGLEEIFLPGHLEEVRARLRAVVDVVRHESERLQSMFDVFRILTDEVRELVVAARDAGQVRPESANIAADKLVESVKECLRVPFVVLCRPDDGGARREVRFLPFSGLGYAQLEDVDLMSLAGEKAVLRAAPPEQLPFWNQRAVRPAPAPAPEGPPVEPSALVDRLVERAGGPRDAAELRALRLWFAPDTPVAALAHALRAAGATAVPQDPRVRAVFYLGEVARPGSLPDPGVAHELIGRAAAAARAFVETYESSVLQFGSLVALVAFERPPFRTRADEPLIGAARFAREVAHAALEQGVVVRAAVCAGEGVVFQDATGRPSVASPAAARAAELLEQARPLAQGRALLAVDGAAALLLTRLGQRLPGWEQAADPQEGCAIWLGPKQ